MSSKWKDRLNPVLKVVNFLLGIGLVGLGIYRYVQVGVHSAKDVFLSFYYIFFGTVLMLFELPYERIHKFFRLLSNPFGKAMFLLWIAAITLNIWDAFYMILAIIAIADAVCHTVYLVLFYESAEATASQPKEKPAKEEKPRESGFGKRNLDENEDVPAGILNRRK
jgi:hypothetical protein